MKTCLHKVPLTEVCSNCCFVLDRNDNPVTTSRPLAVELLIRADNDNSKPYGCKLPVGTLWAEDVQKLAKLLRFVKSRPRAAVRWTKSTLVR